MTVTLTSPALGLDVGDPYTGPEEAWLLAEGYASQAGYTGPGVQNSGSTGVTPDEDPRLPENRESPTGDEPWNTAAGPLDPALIDPDEAAKEAAAAERRPDQRYDFDAGSVNDDAPEVFGLEPATGPLAGGTEVTVVGQNLEGTTGVTFGGTAAASFTVVSDDEVTAVTPAGVAAGAVDVVVTNATGSATETGGYTYE